MTMTVRVCVLVRHVRMFNVAFCRSHDDWSMSLLHKVARRAFNTPPAFDLSAFAHSAD